MQKSKCKMKNFGVPREAGDDYQMSRSDSSILHFAFCTLHLRRKADGFTIIEMVFYTAIVGAIGAILLVFLADSLKSYNKTQAIQHVLNNINGSLRTITDEIRYANSIYTPTSVLNNNSGQLSLATALNAPAGETTTYVDFYLDNGRIYEKREGLAASALTSERVFINALRFSSVSNGGRMSATVRITGQINTSSTNPADQAQLTLSSSAALRGAY